MDVETLKREDGALEVTFDGKTLTCVVCGGNRFDARDSILNSRGSELFGLGWTDEKATDFARTRCGYIFWFRF